MARPCTAWTVLFELFRSPVPIAPACTSSSTRRVETPPIQASWITRHQRLLRSLPGLKKAREVAALPELRQRRFSVPKRVSRSALSIPFRQVVRSPLRSCRPAPMMPSTSVSMISSRKASAMPAEDRRPDRAWPEARTGPCSSGHRGLRKGPWLKSPNSTSILHLDGHPGSHRQRR